MRRIPSQLGHLIADEFCLQAALVLAYFIRHGTLAYSIPLYRNFALVLFVIDALVALLNSSFGDADRRGYYIEASKTLWHAFLVLSISLTYMFAMQYGDLYSRITLFLLFVFHAAIGYAVRAGWKGYRKGHPVPLRSAENMLVVTTPEAARETLAQLKDIGKESAVRIAGVALTDASQEGIGPYPVVCSLDDAADYVCREWIDAVYIDLPLSDLRAQRLMEACSLMGVPTHYHFKVMDGRGILHFSQQMGKTTVLTATRNKMTPGQALLKRLADLVGGLVGSLAALIIMLVVAPLIKRKSPGPVLFRQKRVGRNGRIFTMYKLRTMVMDADRQKAELMARNNVRDGMMFKLDHDPRVIPGIGDWLRRHSLDEFPQFFNVLLGQMSLVGTRPPTVDEYRKYRYHHRARLSVKPGITGLWQVSGRSEIADFEEVVRLDTAYINEWTPGLDLRILVKTVVEVFSGRGAK